MNFLNEAELSNSFIANLSNNLGSPKRSKIQNDFIPIDTFVGMSQEKVMIGQEGEALPYVSNHNQYGGLSGQEMLKIQSGIRMVPPSLGKKDSTMSVLMGEPNAKNEKGDANNQNQILSVDFIQQLSTPIQINVTSKKMISKSRAKTLATDIMLRSCKLVQQKESQQKLLQYEISPQQQIKQKLVATQLTPGPAKHLVPSLECQPEQRLEMTATGRLEVPRNVHKGSASQFNTQRRQKENIGMLNYFNLSPQTNLAEMKKFDKKNQYIRQEGPSLMFKEPESIQRNKKLQIQNQQKQILRNSTQFDKTTMQNIRDAKQFESLELPGNFRNSIQVKSINKLQDDDNDIVSLDKQQFRQIDRAIKKKFLKFQLDQNIDINLKNYQQEQLRRRERMYQMGHSQLPPIITNEVIVSDSHESQREGYKVWDNDSLARSKFTDQTPFIVRVQNKTSMTTSLTNEPEKGQPAKQMKNTTREVAIQDMRVHGSKISRLNTNNFASSLSKHSKYQKQNKFNKTTDNFKTIHRIQEVKELDGHQEKINKDLVNEIDEERLFKQLQQDTKTSQFMNTYFEGFNDQSAIHTKEIDSCQVSRMQDKRTHIHEEGINNEDMMQNIFSKDVSKVSKRPSSLKKGQSYRHVGLTNAVENSSGKNKLDYPRQNKQPTLSFGKKKSEPLGFGGQLNSVKNLGNVTEMQQELRAMDPAQQDEQIQTNFLSQPSQRLLACPSMAIKREDGSQDRDSAIQQSSDPKLSTLPQIRISNIIAQEINDELENNYPVIHRSIQPKDENSLMVSRGISSQQSYISSQGIEQMQMTNHGTYNTNQSMDDPTSPGLRQSTAALMRSYCLYSHEQMRQIEIKKHLDRKLMMSVNAADTRLSTLQAKESKDQGKGSERRQHRHLVDSENRMDLKRKRSKMQTLGPSQPNSPMDLRHDVSQSVQASRHHSNAFSSLEQRKQDQRDQQQALFGLSGQNFLENRKKKRGNPKPQPKGKQKPVPEPLDKVQNGQDCNSFHFNGVLNELALANQITKVFKPAHVHNRSMARYFNNSDAKFMRKDYFKTLREQRESALEVSQTSPRNSPMDSHLDSNVVLRVLSQKINPSQRKLAHQSSSPQDDKKANKQSVKIPNADNYQTVQNQLQMTGMSFKLQNTLSDPNDVHNYHMSRTSGSHSQSFPFKTTQQQQSTNLQYQTKTNQIGPQHGQSIITFQQLQDLSDADLTQTNNFSMRSLQKQGDISTHNQSINETDFLSSKRIKERIHRISKSNLNQDLKTTTQFQLQKRSKSKLVNYNFGPKQKDKNSMALSPSPEIIKIVKNRRSDQPTGNSTTSIQQIVIDKQDIATGIDPQNLSQTQEEMQRILQNRSQQQLGQITEISINRISSTFQNQKKQQMASQIIQLKSKQQILDRFSNRSSGKQLDPNPSTKNLIDLHDRFTNPNDQSDLYRNQHQNLLEKGRKLAMENEHQLLQSQAISAKNVQLASKFAKLVPNTDMHLSNKFQTLVSIPSPNLQKHNWNKMDKNARSQTPDFKEKPGKSPKKKSNLNYIAINKRNMERYLDSQLRYKEASLDKSNSVSNSEKNQAFRFGLNNPHDQSSLALGDQGMSRSLKRDDQRDENNQININQLSQSNFKNQSTQILVEINKTTQSRMNSSIEETSPDNSPKMAVNPSNHNLLDQNFNSVQLLNDKESLAVESDACKSIQLQPTLAQGKVIDGVEPTLNSQASPPGIQDFDKQKKKLSPNVQQFKSRLILPVLGQSHLSPLELRDKTPRISQSLMCNKVQLRKQKQNTQRQVNDLLKHYYEDKLNKLIGGVKKSKRWRQKMAVSELDNPRFQHLDKITPTGAGIRNYGGDGRHREWNLDLWDPNVSSIISQHNAHSKNKAKFNHSPSQRR